MFSREDGNKRKNRFTKKRLDRDRNHSRFERTKNLGKTALAVGAGAVFFRRSNMGNRLIKTAESLSPMAKDFKKSLRGKNYKDLKTLKKSFEKNFGKNGSKIKEEFIKSKTMPSSKINKDKAKRDIKNKLQLSTKRKGLVQNLHNIKQVTESGRIKRDILKSEVDEKLMRQIKDEIRDKKIDKNIYSLLFKDRNFEDVLPTISNLDEDKVDQIVQSIYKKIESKSHGTSKKASAVINTINPKTFEGLNISNEEKENLVRIIEGHKIGILDKASDTRQGSTRKKLLREAERKAERLTQEIQDVAMDYNSLEHSTNNTIYNKLDRFFERLGFDISSEEFLTGSRTATLKDFMDAGIIGDTPELIQYDTTFENSLMNKIEDDKKKIELFNVKKELEKLAEGKRDKNGNVIDNRFENLIVDRHIKVMTNEDGEKILYDTHNTSTFFEKAIKRAKNTLPGNILFKYIDDYDQDIIDVLPANKRTGTAFIQNASRKLEGDNLITDNKTRSTMVHIAGKTYDILSNGEDWHLDVANAVEQKMVKGYKAIVAQRLLGKSDRYAPEAYRNSIAQLLDINQEGTFNILNSIKRKFNKFDDDSWSFNILERTRDLFISDREYLSENNSNEYLKQRSLLKDINTSISSLSKDDKKLLDGFMAITQDFENLDITKQRIYSDMKHLYKQLDNIIPGVTDNMAYMLSESLEDDDIHKTLLNSLLDNDLTSFFNTIIDEDNRSKIKNKKLNNLIEGYLENSKNMLEYSRVKKQEKSRLLSGILGEYIPDEAIDLDFTGQLKIEVVKDLFYNSSLEESKELINNLENLNPLESTLFKDIRLLSYFEQDLKFDSTNQYSNNLFQVFEKYNGLDSFIDKLNTDEELVESLTKGINQLERSHNLLSDTFEIELNERDYTDYSKNIYVNRSSIGKIFDSIGYMIVNDLNEGITMLSGALADTGKELLGGRFTPENITDLTLQAQYMIDRLNFGLDTVGLSLSSRSTANVLDTVKNVALKRILPTIAIGSTFSMLNYESEKLTGVSLKGATANSIMNVDLAGRRLLDATHISSALDWLAETSVIHEYWTGQRHFNTHDEQLDWYENGYTPVRGGRFWFFGSSSEVRGNDITYYQPNFVRRAHSNYKDVSIYGSIDEKWAHSWIPTPQHPLAPIRNLLDPYWLEKKHLEEGDRPYPLTGKLFSEGTPWAAVLNPTVGQILKPVTMLPEVKERLGRDGRDAEAIIERLNTRIKQLGSDNEYDYDDLLMIRGADIRNAEYVPYAHPEDDELVLSYRNNQVYAQGLDYMDNIQDISEYETPDGAYYNESEGYGKVSQQSREVQTQSTRFLNRLESAPVSAVEDTEIRAANIIKQINEYIKNGKNVTPTSRNRVSLNNAPNGKNEGVFITRNLANERIRLNEDYYSEKDIKYMVDKNIYKDLRRDAIYSAKELSGIYGYLEQQILGDKGYTYRFEHAGQMTAFTRGFWDASIGGLGGDTMEIVRRFFPSEDKSRVNINPLKNNMPDWITNTGSYDTGDPYIQIPKGEMRLPGRGYETLNELHPDMFGRRNCRTKIVRIAGNSLELQILTMHSDVA